MSVQLEFSKGWVISHEDYINKLYSDVQDLNEQRTYSLNKGLFNIANPFRKLKEVTHKRKHSDTSEKPSNMKILRDLVQNIYKDMENEIKQCLRNHSVLRPDTNAIDVSSSIYESSNIAAQHSCVGANTGSAKSVTINGEKYLFPENCEFYCKDVAEIELFLINVNYNLIVLDPPWWNKYIRRKKAKTNHGYSMMYNKDLKTIPIENLLTEDGVLVVWCTNSTQNFDDLKEIFIKWNIHLAARWFWLKVSLDGKTICSFSEPPGKQPFEQIIIGVRNPEFASRIPDNKVVISVPSALHSHKPPLIELLQDLLPSNPKCLELFARYTLPNWTSWGLEALRFQHHSLFEECIHNK